MFKIKTKFNSISENDKVYIIAEACDNHLGSLDKAKQMCELAKDTGASAIKFQHHIPDEEMLKDVPMSSNFNMPLYEFLKKYALSIEDHKILNNYCEKLEIDYLCTPFSYKAAEDLNNNLDLQVYKIGSGESTDIPTLSKITKNLKKSLIISTGMSLIEENEETYNKLKKINANFCFMYCVSEYPPVYEDMNLNVITKLKQKFKDICIGHSDHTPDNYTCFSAVTLGAKIIEKHVIIDKKQEGPDQSVSINFDELADLVSGIRKIEKSLGDEKKIHLKEQKIREWAFRSIVSTKEIKKNQTITEDMIWSKRPGTGIPAKLMNKVIGKKTKKLIKENEMLSWDDIE